MTASSAAKKSKAGRAFLGIAILAVMLAAALTGAWYTLANRLDTAVREAIEAAAGGGTTIACDGQEVFGYPFRIGLRCARIDVDVPAKSLRASAGALRTAAQIYRPDRIVGEIDGPMVLEAPGLAPLDVRWSLLQASAHFWTEGVDRLAIVVEKPDVGLAGPAGARTALVRSDRLEVHARRRGEDLDLAFDDDRVKVLQPGLEALPPFHVSADLTVAGAADWLSGRRPGDTIGEALRGRSGALRSLAISVAEPGRGSAAVSGPFSVDGNGEVSGRFDVALIDAPAIADLAGRLVPDMRGIAGTIASGIGLVGRNENGRTVVRVDVREGEASLGFIRLGRIPPLR